MDWNISLTLDLLGVFFFAVSGSLLAARRGFDIIGSLLLGSMVGLGGGVVRDVIINAGVPAAFSQPLYVVPPVVAAVLVYFLFQYAERGGRLLTLFDAGGLALFCVTGTLKALTAGMNPVTAILLGVTTAVGGGLLRDITANEVPQLFDSKDLYAIPAFLGAGLTTLLWGAGALNLLTGTTTAVVVFGLRVLAWRQRWHAPLAARGWTRTAAIRD
ncbi:trimeric intracellular cation channel family protein [Paenarthrobacter sp. Z7-10]|uniref:trimeric intracellular cation channel family protein n=1 Tax=Paenarthrobacter sp. Z7-10 TaxID=2787635 RepID=UPI0022A91CD3|nr:trimeric intracellular cation channel family protein [Paenarthrobacter sp. Z7-10]MCZ2402295.1 trimeric intracellular cation channel family protein [Paenarthrobacter sp. Z7-10]